MEKRALSEEMFHSFVEENGKWHKLLEIVKRDKTLDLEFRGNKACIYYRGGVLFTVTNDGLYFNTEYSRDYPECEIELLANPSAVYAIKNIPFYKQAIDYNVDAKGKMEREFEQLVVRDNNYARNDIAIHTDYFIADMEYKVQGNDTKPEFDLVAIKWPTTKRGLPESPTVALIEMKYGDNAICTKKPSGEDKVGNPGLKKHLEDFRQFLANEATRKEFCKDMEEIFNQKCRLGICIIDNSEKQQIRTPICIKNFTIEVIFLLANHQPRSCKLHKELQTINFSDYDFPVRFAVSSMMGYGLYDNGDTMWSPERCKFFAASN